MCATVTRANGEQKRWRKLASPDGTRPLSTLTSTGGISATTCWSWLCGTSPGHLRRTAPSWERYSTPLHTPIHTLRINNVGSPLSQILIELETALLDDKPHWYPLQTHDVSSIPLPRPSPFLPRRHPQSDAPGKKLQRKCDPVKAWSCVDLCVSCVACVSVVVEGERKEFNAYVHVYVCSHDPSCPEPGCVNVGVLCTYICVCLCIYECLGSQRVTEPEFDERAAVLYKGGWHKS